MSRIQTVLHAYRGGATQRQIAADMAITQRTVCRIVVAHIPSDERAAIRAARKISAGPVRSARVQKTKIARGLFAISRGQDEVRATIGGVTFTFDADDEAILHRFSWRLSTDHRLTRQRRSGTKLQSVYVYHDIMGVQPNRRMVVDHINRDPRDNRRANLRVCTQSENCRNRSVNNGRRGGKMARHTSSLSQEDGQKDVA